MPEFDDINQPAHFRAQVEYSMSIIDRYTVLLRDGETTATIYPIHSAEELPPGLLLFLCDELNMEVERGDTFPFFDNLDLESFQNYWFGSFALVMVLGDAPTLDRSRQWEKECLGTFYIKPNYPGRCSHICTAGFLVNAGIRGKGIGRTLAECYLEWAPRLGYTYSTFNLVFDTNVLAKKIWDSLGFKVIGKIKAAGILKGHNQPVDACIYGRELMLNLDPSGGSFRFDRIKYYLETGKYPKNLDRPEKSRLRSSASHYRLIDGKLMLKGREVISDPVKQLEIATAYHQAGHPGINKSTSAILEKYHWSRIKDTVAIVLRDCDECRMQRGLVLKRPSSHHPRAANGLKHHDHKQVTPRLPSSQRKGPEMQLPHHFTQLETSEDHDPVLLLHHHHHQGHPDQNLLALDFDSDDPSGIIAAVEALQRSHSHVQHLDGAHESHHHLDDRNNVGSKPGRSNSSADHHLYNYEHDPHENEHNYNYEENNGIDPDVISRALIQANEDHGEDKIDM